MTEIRKTSIPDLLEIVPRVFEDARGHFFESFREDWLLSHGVNEKWVQDNQSSSKAGTIRGLHFQRGHHAQAKLVRVLQGKVLDVAVDLRAGSDSFGQVFTVVLDSKRNNQLYVPRGFAHGFSVLEDSIFAYKCSNYYHKEAEGGIIWNDPDLQIDWGVTGPTISEKDLVLPTLQEFIKKEGALQ